MTTLGMYNPFAPISEALNETSRQSLALIELQRREKLDEIQKQATLASIEQQGLHNQLTKYQIKQAEASETLRGKIAMLPRTKTMMEDQFETFPSGYNEGTGETTYDTTKRSMSREVPLTLSETYGNIANLASESGDVNTMLNALGHQQQAQANEVTLQRAQQQRFSDFADYVYKVGKTFGKQALISNWSSLIMAPYPDLAKGMKPSDLSTGEGWGRYDVKDDAGKVTRTIIYDAEGGKIDAFSPQDSDLVDARLRDIESRVEWRDWKMGQEREGKPDANKVMKSYEDKKAAIMRIKQSSDARVATNKKLKAADKREAYAANRETAEQAMDDLHNTMRADFEAIGRPLQPIGGGIPKQQGQTKITPVVGKTYVDANGKKAKYLGGNKWQPVP